MVIIGNQIQLNINFSRVAQGWAIGNFENSIFCIPCDQEIKVKQVVVGTIRPLHTGKIFSILGRIYGIIRCLPKWHFCSDNFFGKDFEEGKLIEI